MNRIRIKSDGTGAGTHIFLVNANGREEKVDGVRAVRWSVEGRTTATAVVDFSRVEVDVVGEVPALEQLAGVPETSDAAKP
jgi:hypothetical protein